jgi:menaquinone-specific isochorismate synthase
VPKDAALSAMRAIEGRDRGPYAGPVGWFDGTGDGELFVALRSASFDGARAEIFAGSGIVRGSSPIREAEETRAKARTIGSVLGVAL